MDQQAIPPPIETVREPAAEVAAATPVMPPPLPEHLVFPAAEPIPIPPKAFPGVWQALGLMAMLIVAQGVMAGLLYFAAKQWMTNAVVLGIINSVSFGAICAFAGWRMKVPALGLFTQAPPAGTFSGANLLALQFAIIGQLLCSVGLVFAIGGKGILQSEQMKQLNSVVGEGQAWWAVVPLLVLVAPITEEVFFRGQLLRGFLARYAPTYAIGASAVLFSAMHMNPVQVPATLMLGILSGTLYHRTRSVWPSIVAHMLNNAVPAIAIVSGRTAQAQASASKANLEPTLGATLALIAAGFAIWFGALAMLRRNVPAAVDESPGVAAAGI
jgi:uncharacterized protein